jgi:uncharacterized protein YfiM (DUF2279 family)
VALLDNPNPVVVGTCNKCRDRKPLVFEAHVCEGCSRALDERWAANDSTNWVLVEALAVGSGPVYGPHVGIRNDRGQVIHSFEGASYAYVKSVWAAYKGGAWSIRPATAEELLNGSRRLQILYAIDETLQKYGFYSEGNPPGGIWHEVALLCGKKTLNELKKKLADLGFFPRLDAWQLPEMGLSVFEISKCVDEHPRTQIATTAESHRQILGSSAATIPEGDCKKCGARAHLVFQNCICEPCRRALDKRWGSNTSTDWLLVERPAEGAEATYRKCGKAERTGRSSAHISASQLRIYEIRVGETWQHLVN